MRSAQSFVLRRRLLLQRLALCITCAAGAGATAAWPIEEPLSQSVRTALSAAIAMAEPPQPVLASVPEQQAYAQWLAGCDARLARWLRQSPERQEFLQTLWYEARRAGVSLSLVLGLIQAESAFRKYAISSAGARGYMQVMPFWMRTIGDGDESKLFHLQSNLRFGCVILRYCLDREQGDVWMGLGRYNGSRGQAPYPRAVLAAQRLWLQAVD